MYLESNTFKFLNLFILLKILTSLYKIWEACEYLVQVGEKNGVAAEWPKWQVRQANIWAEIFRIL